MKKYQKRRLILDRTQVLEILEPILDTQVRRIDHSPRTRVVVTPEVVTFRPGGGARMLEMTQEGVRNMANFIGLPIPVAKNLHPDTFSRVSTELLEAKSRYSLVLKEQRISAFAKVGDYRVLNTERVLRTIEAAIPGAEYNRVMVLPDHACSIELVGDRRQPVRAGDLVQAGANIAFSPIGTIEPLVQSYVLRLECTNGATSNHIIRKFEGGDGGGEGDGIWQWFRKSVSEAYHAIDSIVRQYQRMLEEEIRPEDRALMLAAMLRKAKITGGLAEAVRNLAIERSLQTSYDMHNLITYASSHILPEGRQVRQAQEAAAEYLSEESHQRICPLCHRER